MHINIKDVEKAYFKARRHKKYTTDVKNFDRYFEKNFYNLIKSIKDGTYNAKQGNYAFVVYRPKPREIFGTCFNNRIVHHLLDFKLRPIYEKVLSPRTFNNRKGKGVHKAIRNVAKDVWLQSKRFTKDCYVLHLDIKGYFPNASVEVALSQQLHLIQEYYQGKDKSTLYYLMKEVLKADPARNCTKIAPDKNWNKIVLEKSLFNKPVGIGGAIGFLCWQNAMLLYINKMINYVDNLGYKITVFVDDIFIVSKTKRVLYIIPRIREILGSLKMVLNKKFYFQHYSKGILVLGTMIKYNRLYLNRKSIYNSWSKVKANLGSVNSYAGLYNGKNSYKFFTKFANVVKILGFKLKSNYCFI